MEYQNYRFYLRDFYLDRKERSGFTWRDFAKMAGYSSPVFLKLVSEKKANLSNLGVERVAASIGLSGVDLEYFRALVAFNQSKKDSEKKELYKKLRALAKDNGMKLLGADQFDYFESWINPVIRELAPNMPFSSAKEIAEKVIFDASSSQVKNSLKLLENLGLLKKDLLKKYIQTNLGISTGALESVSLSVREMHKQMGDLAVKSLENIPITERDISGLTMGLSKEGFNRAKMEIEAFRKRMASIALSDMGTDKVYRLNLQLFPLTKSIGNPPQKKGDADETK